MARTSDSKSDNEGSTPSLHANRRLKMNLDITEVREQLGGISKYRLAKMLNVRWNTVHLWEIGRFKPSFIHLERILGLLKSAPKKDDNKTEGESNV